MNIRTVYYEYLGIWYVYAECDKISATYVGITERHAVISIQYLRQSMHIRILNTYTEDHCHEIRRCITVQLYSNIPL